MWAADGECTSSCAKRRRSSLDTVIPLALIMTLLQMTVSRLNEIHRPRLEMLLLSTILLPFALGLLMANGVVAEDKPHDPVAIAATHLRAGKFEAAEEELRKVLGGHKRQR